MVSFKICFGLPTKKPENLWKSIINLSVNAVPWAVSISGSVWARMWQQSSDVHNSKKCGQESALSTETTRKRTHIRAVWRDDHMTCPLMCFLEDSWCSHSVSFVCVCMCSLSQACYRFKQTALDFHGNGYLDAFYVNAQSPCGCIVRQGGGEVPWNAVPSSWPVITHSCSFD